MFGMIAAGGRSMKRRARVQAAQLAGVERACAEGDGQACLQAAMRMANMKGGVQDFDKWRGYLEKGHEAGVAIASGLFWRFLVSNNIEPERAASLQQEIEARLKTPDEEADPDAMLAHAHYLELLDDPARNEVKDKLRECARDRFKALADQGAPQAALKLSYMMREGKGGPVDHFGAEPYLARACAKDVAQACFELGMMYDDGRGVVEDLEKARRLFEKACHLEDVDGCFNLSMMYDFGRGGNKDKAISEQLAEKALSLAARGDVVTVVW